MEYSAIFHDMDKRFCYAIDKDLFVIRVQVKKDDIIILAGKGHETYQEVNHVKHHMDEREIVADYLSSGR